MLEEASEHSEAITKSLNPRRELIAILVERGVLSDEERKSIVGEVCRNKQRQQLFECLKRQPGSFIHCLEDENTHWGHRYIVALMRGEVQDIYLPSQIRKSKLYEERVLERKQLMICDIDMTYLSQVMYERGLLAPSEYEEIEEIQRLKSRTHGESNRLFFNDILISKGPLAYLHFIHCLEEECKVPRHAEIFEDIVGCKPKGAKKRLLVEISDSESDDDDSGLPKSACKRRAIFDSEIQEPLTGAKYNDLMKILWKCHHNGDWDGLESKVKTVVNCSTTEPQLKVVALLEMARGYIFQKNWKLVDKFTCLARDETVNAAQCTKLNVNNAYLHCRIKLICTLQHIFLGSFKEAKQYLDEARESLFNVGINMPRSEYAPWLSYCSGFIQLEEMQSQFPDNDACKLVVTTFQTVIEHAKLFGCFDGLVEHSRLRLAQFYLKCSHFTAGTADNPHSIRQAQHYLNSVDISNLSLRSQAIYHTVCSDMSRNNNEREKAEMHAKTALDISSKAQYMTELEAAKLRLTALQL